MRITINFFKMMLLLTATSFFSSSSCNKNGSKPCRNGRYSFNVTSEFSPQKEIYNVGDTIYITSSFPKILTDLISNEQVDYGNSLGVGGNFNFISMDSTNKTVTDALNSFSANAITGKIALINSSSNLKLSISFLENPNNYVFKASVKLLSKGLFYFVITDLGSQGIRGQDCTNAGFSMTVTNTNKNLTLFDYGLGYPPDALLAKNIYCFRVK